MMLLRMVFVTSVSSTDTVELVLFSVVFIVPRVRMAGWVGCTQCLASRGACL